MEEWWGFVGVEIEYLDYGVVGVELFENWFEYLGVFLLFWLGGCFEEG